MDYTTHERKAQAYARAEFKNTYRLGYRDIGGILSKFVKGVDALDYGCGTGRSTRFLKELGYSCLGVDISSDMIELARKADPKGEYNVINTSETLLESESVDLFFSCFVFLTVPSFAELKKIFKEASRVLKKGGVLNFVTGSKYLYIKKYISYDVSSKSDLTSGDEVNVCLKDLGVEFKNYFWSDDDYRDLIKEAGLELVHFEMPFGLPSDSFEWMDESSYSPYVIYTARKN